MDSKKKHPGGRPVLDLDEKQILELAKVGCTMREMSAVMKCSEDTLSRRYAGVIEQGRQLGCMSLRHAQFKLALSGNCSMLQWLGRFHLGQKEELTFSSTEPEVRALLLQWDISAKKKSSFDRTKDQKIVAIGE